MVGSVRMKEVAPCVAMVAVEGLVVALTIMARTAMARGMSPFVFVVYTNILGSIILLPYSLYERERSKVPILSLKFLLPVFLLGLIGITIAQNLAFVGLSYSSPIVTCGMANQIPAFSFVLGIILRTAKFDWKSSGSQIRLCGTLISFAGAISLTLYKGPTIRSQPFSSLAFPPPAEGLVAPLRMLVFSSPHENWILGCLLFAASSFTLAVWNIIVQVGTVKMCGQVMKIISFYSLFGTIQSALLAVLMERDVSAWRLELNFELLVIVLTAIFSSLIRTDVLIWCARSKGPYFVPAFKPLGIPYTTVLGCLLFAHTFNYGSMMGAFICGVGYYTVLWGEIKDGEMHKFDDGRYHDSLRAEKVPLLPKLLVKYKIIFVRSRKRISSFLCIELKVSIYFVFITF